jgi:DNA processing protein
VARAWLLGRLAGHLDPVRARIDEALELGDDELVAAVAGRDRAAIERDRERLDLAERRAACEEASVAMVCRCDPHYPVRLHDLLAPPAVLHVGGGMPRLLALAALDPVAVVGSRRPSEYGREMARTVARGVASAGVTVISGMALGIDAAAHAGALEAASGATIAVLPGGVDRPYPATGRPLYRKIVKRAAAVSELPPGISARRWMFPARNRIIAALAVMTVVVEATERSGALITARVAMRLGRSVGAMPGRVTSPLAVGPHSLLVDGASLVLGPREVLEELYGAEGPELIPAPDRAPLDPVLLGLLDQLGAGRETSEALAAAGFSAGDGLAALSSLELGGYVRRAAGGRYTVIP